MNFESCLDAYQQKIFILDKEAFRQTRFKWDNLAPFIAIVGIPTASGIVLGRSVPLKLFGFNSLVLWAILARCCYKSFQLLLTTYEVPLA